MKLKDWFDKNTQGIQVFKGRAHRHGCCSGCNHFITTSGMIDHDVYVIKLRGTEIRLCNYCKVTVMGMLRLAQ